MSGFSAETDPQAEAPCESERMPNVHGDGIAGHECIPIYGELLVSVADESDQLAQQLYWICRATEDMSGRDLRRLPALSVSMCLYGQQHSLTEVIDAMEKVLKQSGESAI